MVRLPGRPEQHRVGDVAAAVFELALPPAWARNRSQSDYGWDFIVAISRGGEVGPQFFTQVKGSENVTYLADGAHLSHPLEISAIRWLLGQSMPAMLAVCDVGRPDRPVYWVWIHEAVTERERDNPAWAEQETLTLRIPVANHLGAETHERVERDVRRWHEAMAIGLQALRVLAPTSDLPTLPIGGHPPSDPTLRMAVFSTLERRGLAQVFSTEEGTQVEPYSDEDQRRLTVLEEVKTLLDAYQDRAARGRLDTLTADLEHAAPRLQARYFNSRGIIALRDDDRVRAVEAFRRAASIQPDDDKYATNLLTAEYNAGWEPEASQRRLPDDWDQRLEAVLSRGPGRRPAIQIRALRIATTAGPRDAEEFLRSSAVWESDRQDALFLLADIWRQAHDLPRALEYVEQAEAAAVGPDAHVSALKGEVLYLLATQDPSQLSNVIYGFGPSALNLQALRRADEAYRIACEQLAQHGYPRIAEHAVRGAAIVSLLLSRPRAAEDLCRSYLARHPDAHGIHGVMAMALEHQNDYGGAVSHARDALAGDPTSSQTYINLLVVLLVAEEYRGLLEAVQMRQHSGFLNQHEEDASREFAAIAYANLGEFEHARQQIEQLRARDELAARAVVAEAMVMRAEGVAQPRVVERLRAEAGNHPGEAMVLTALIHELLPPTAENAAEIVHLFERLRSLRQLAPEEMAAFGRAYLALDRPRDGAIVFESARTRYPDDPRFLFEHAHVLTRLGDDDGAYEAMHTYLEVAARDQLVYRNMGQLARATGRLDEAIEMFERALQRAGADTERGELHCQLWELRRRRGDPPRQILRHVIGYGQLAGGAPDAEARYLILGLLTPGIDPEAADPEIAVWVREFRLRLEAFVEAHPRFAGLQRFRIPDNLTADQQRAFLFSEMAARSLPGYLLRSQFELLVRGAAWPLSTRSMFLAPGRSVFQYWQACTESREYAHGLHIHEPPLRVDEEAAAVPVGGRVCADLSALLTLALLELLDEVTDVFSEVIVPRGAVRIVRSEFIGIDTPHPVAERLREWFGIHRRRIRFQAADGVSDRPGRASAYQRLGPLWVPIEPNLAELVPDGVGEALLLGRQLGIPLYSDEATIRLWARETYGVTSFSTVALLTALRQTGRLTLENETRCLARLITRNYRRVPFTADHLHSRLSAILETPLAEDIDADEILGPLLRELGNTERNEGEMIQVAIRWWLAMLNTPGMPERALRGIVRRISFTLGQRADGFDARLAAIWAAWLLVVYQAGDLTAVARAWDLIQSSAEELMPGNEQRYRRLIFEQVPDQLYELIHAVRGWNDDDRDLAIIALSGQLPRPAMDRLLHRRARARR